MSEATPKRHGLLQAGTLAISVNARSEQCLQAFEPSAVLGITRVVFAG
jgi:hypothetical protein